jgi:hypothetical protein
MGRIIHGKDKRSNTWKCKDNTWDDTWEDFKYILTKAQEFFIEFF